MKDLIVTRLTEAAEVKKRIAADHNLYSMIETASKACITSLKNNGKILFCGNGGSAADAQHLSAELTGRYYFNRKPLFAEALHVNTSYLTAVANDYSYNEIYARLVEGMGRKGDVLVALSTSGNSANILLAVEKARSLGMFVIAMTGQKGGKLKDLADVTLRMPTDDTPRIQEGHILVGHVICELIEREFIDQ